MIYEIKYTADCSTGIILKDDGTINFYTARASEGQFSFSTPIRDYESFLITLDCLHNIYPLIYNIVSDHVQNRDELTYQNIRNYCIERNNELTHKLK